MALLTDPNTWIALLTLATMEIVLSIDNLIFIAVLTERLPADRQALARRLGLAMAVIGRVALLSTIAWIMRLSEPVFGMGGFVFSWRDIILIAGGLFLVYKGTTEIHERLEGDAERPGVAPKASGLIGTLAQIVVLDIVFSLDSVIAAVGMANRLEVMVAAIVLAILAMMFAARPLTSFIGRHPTVKMLAFSFLLLIGMTLIADGCGFHVPKGYIYAAMAFSALVESLNLVAARRRR